MQKISFNFIFNIYSNIINCLITSSQIAEFNSSLALQHDYYIFVKYIIINLQSFIHNLTDKQNEWIKFLNNIFTSSMIINKIIDMNYYLLLNLFTTILNMLLFKFLSFILIINVIHDFRYELQNSIKFSATLLRRISWKCWWFMNYFNNN